jgi:D-psicose/D-tagatose/L-ribulose 3-epimerase
MTGVRATRRLGVCTWTFGDLPLDEIARRVKALGFDGVALPGNLVRYRAAEAGRILADHGLEMMALTPDSVDLAHPDATVRSKALDYYLRLLDFAGELGAPLVGCHGCVGRVRALSTVAQERVLLGEAVRQIAERAEELGLRLVIEALNRYESHLLNSAAEVLAFVEEVDNDHCGILLDAYHMNIEESDPAAALRLAGERLWLYHAADSNRQGIGRGHIDFAKQVAALADVGYAGPIILECTAPGPDPFAAVKDARSLRWLEVYLQESCTWLKSVA